MKLNACFFLKVMQKVSFFDISAQSLVKSSEGEKSQKALSDLSKQASIAWKESFFIAVKPQGAVLKQFNKMNPNLQFYNPFFGMDYMNGHEWRSMNSLRLIHFFKIKERLLLCYSRMSIVLNESLSFSSCTRSLWKEER